MQLLCNNIIITFVAISSISYHILVDIVRQCEAFTSHSSSTSTSCTVRMKDLEKKRREGCNNDHRTVQLPHFFFHQRFIDNKDDYDDDIPSIISSSLLNNHIQTVDDKIDNDIIPSTPNRRRFLSSLLMTSALATTASLTFNNNNNVALADEITWTNSPINKRSGITVYKAEETYNLQFITYLSRFLLNFDEECQRWWFKRASDIPRTASAQQVDQIRQKQFGSFAASVEVGLQTFEGDDGPLMLMESLLERYGKDIEEIKRIREENGLPPYNSVEENYERGEIKEARRQIALLFGLLTTANQPVERITKLLAAIDNASIQKISIVKRGGGYALGYGPPAVTFPLPEAGDGYEVATGRVSLKTNGQILRIDITKRGFGYSKAPNVTISQPNNINAEAATAKAVLFRDGVNKGRIEKIELLTPGSGYQVDEPIKITLSPPDLPSSQGGESCVATAVLEYEIDKVDIINGGSGYAAEKPLKITIDPPPPTARFNLNDPMVVKSLKLDKQFQRKMGSDADSAIAYAYPITETSSYSSFRSQKDTKVDSNDKFISASGDDYVPKFPLVGIGSSFLSLLPKGIGLSYNNDLNRYELAASEGFNAQIDISSLANSKPIDTDFGPRGRSPIEREKNLTGDLFLRFFVAGALCQSSAHLMLTPIDVIKTSIQTDSTRFPDPITTVKKIWKESGVAGLFLGWVPTLIGFFINGGISYSLTEYFRRFYFDLAGDNAVNYQIPIIMAGSASAAVFCALTLPVSESIRVRSVAQPNYGPNAFGIATRMIKEEGVLSLFSAVPAFLFKEIPFSVTKFTIFKVSTEYMYDLFPVAREDLQLSLLVSLAGGTIGGISAAIITNPADATISAMKKAKSDKSPLETLKNMIQTDGISSLFRGLGVRLFFVTLIVSIQFVLYDAIRFSFGIGSDDMKLYLDVLGGALNEKGGPI